MSLPTHRSQARPKDCRRSQARLKDCRRSQAKPKDCRHTRRLRQSCQSPQRAPSAWEPPQAGCQGGDPAPPARHCSMSTLMPCRAHRSRAASDLLCCRHMSGRAQASRACTGICPVTGSPMCGRAHCLWRLNLQGVHYHEASLASLGLQGASFSVSSQKGHLCLQGPGLAAFVCRNRAVGR